MTDPIDLGFAGSTIAAHQTLPVLYVAAPTTQNGGVESFAAGAVVRLEADGAVAQVDPVRLEHGYAYLSLDRRDRFLLGVNYRAGQVDVYRMKPDGSIGDCVTQLDEGRMNAHCILTSPDNRFAYIPYVKKTNALFQYQFDPDSGSLESLTPKNANPPEGTGPRHMAYHPTLPVAYFSNEQRVGVTVYDREDSGQLVLKQICDAMAQKQPRDGVSSSDIVITPDGRFVYIGVRGAKQNLDRIARYRVLEEGELQFLGLTAADETPWGLALSPDGRLLFVSAFRGETLTAYSIGYDGALTKAATLPWPKQISDLICR